MEKQVSGNHVRGDNLRSAVRREVWNGGHMKKIRVIVAATIILILCFSLEGCRYTSHWKATMFVHTNTKHEASMSFSDFEGTMVHTLKNDSDTKGRLRYSGKITAGELKIYIDDNQSKEEKRLLCTLRAGEELPETIYEPLNQGTVYVIVETSGSCEDGRLNFELD